mmetsp:Transcript_46745/g.84373  ORF Transcript_46745/g.84373 Transcript_46745/m.84373 type:complete len:235 (+) Transcript_46745:317-1021(+)
MIWSIRTCSSPLAFLWRCSSAAAATAAASFSARSTTRPAAASRAALSTLDFAPAEPTGGKKLKTGWQLSTKSDVSLAAASIQSQEPAAAAASSEASGGETAGGGSEASSPAAAAASAAAACCASCSARIRSAAKSALASATAAPRRVEKNSVKAPSPSFFHFSTAIWKSLSTNGFVSLACARNKHASSLLFSTTTASGRKAAFGCASAPSSPASRKKALASSIVWGKPAITKPR